MSGAVGSWALLMEPSKDVQVDVDLILCRSEYYVIIHLCCFNICAEHGHIETLGRYL